MKFHIVRNKETLEDILYIYNLNKDELIENNKHIRVWDKLIPGTKLKIPSIPDSVDLEVTDMEPFVEDYYPQINEEVVTPVANIEEDDYKAIDDDEEIYSTEQLEQQEQVTEETKDNSKLQSSNIYEDYAEEDSNVELDTKEAKLNEEDDKKVNPQELYYYSNFYPKPLFNNYYPYYLGVYNAPRYIPYPIIYYPVYIQKRN